MWITIAAAMLLRLLLGLLLSHGLLRASTPVDTGLELGADDVRESTGVTVPVTLGLIRPVILLPIDWRVWDRGKLLAVLAHERAHVLRRDPLRQVSAAIYRGLCWFHPLAWWLYAHLIRLAEAASDDEALHASQDRVQYAEALLGFFDRAPNRVHWEGVGMARKGKATQRIERILDGRRTLTSASPRGVLAALVISGVALTVAVSAVWPVRAHQRADTTEMLKFAGKWTYDLESSKRTYTAVASPPPADTRRVPPPPPPPPPALSDPTQPVEITWSGEVLTIRGGEAGSRGVMRIKVDGSEVAGQTVTDERIRRISRTRFENGTIITDWRVFRGDEQIVEGQDIRRLSDDGNRQIVDKTGRTTFGENHEHFEYVRQQ